MEKTSSTQEELFNEIVGIKYRIQGLASFVQNDFDRMLEDGTVTVGSIKTDISYMEDQFDDVIAHLTVLRKQCKDIMSSYCN